MSTVLESIVHQTKLFASQKKVNLELCLEEMQAFLGLNIAMGVLRLPQVRDYWSTHDILVTPWFPIKCDVKRSLFPHSEVFASCRLHLTEEKRGSRF